VDASLFVSPQLAAYSARRPNLLHSYSGATDQEVVKCVFNLKIPEATPLLRYLVAVGGKCGISRSNLSNRTTLPSAKASAVQLIPS